MAKTIAQSSIEFMVLVGVAIVMLGAISFIVFTIQPRTPDVFIRDILTISDLRIGVNGLSFDAYNPSTDVLTIVGIYADDIQLNLTNTTLLPQQSKRLYSYSLAQLPDLPYSYQIDLIVQDDLGINTTIDFRVSGSSITTSGHIALDEPIARKMLGYWNFDEDDPTDDSGFGQLDGSLVQSSGSATISNGLIGNSLFTVGAGYMTVDDNISYINTLGLGDTFTTSVWIKPVFNWGTGSTFYFQNSNANNNCNSRCFTFYIFNSSGTARLYGRTLNTTDRDIFFFDFDNNLLETWMHVVHVINTTQTMMYFNGELTKTELVSTAATGSTIDYDLTFGRTMDVDMDEVAIWNRTLTSEEVKSLYLRGVQSN